MYTLERLEVGKYTVISKVDSIFYKNLIILKIKNINQIKVYLDDFGNTDFNVLLLFKILRKYILNNSTSYQNRNYDEKQNICNHSFITSISTIIKNNNNDIAIEEIENIINTNKNELVNDILDEIDFKKIDNKVKKINK